MPISPELIIYGLIFVGVLVVVEGAYLTVFGKSISLNNRVSRRLDMMNKGQGRQDVLEQLRKEMAAHAKGTQIPLYSLLSDKAQKAAIAFSPEQLMLIMAGLSVAAFTALTMGTESGPIANAVIAGAAGIGGVYTWVGMKANKRMSLIEEQLPDAIELMVRSLKVGHPFSSAVQIVAKELPDPLVTEFGMIADESAYGRDVAEALKEMAERLDMQDMRFLAVAVAIQQQSGGNLAEILAGLSSVIRARFRLFRRVKAITAEAKWSGKFLSGFPVLALVFINVTDPGYYDEVRETALFIPGCIAVGMFLAANLFVMRILTNIKV
ncbi:MAG: type II secretion system F family protein [Cognatishimia sp.]|uniref:type II secretion system F family protein n=1 Tax=Cognatishimia sp. TaxID=2211648 RepID=UPI004059CA52